MTEKKTITDAALYGQSETENWVDRKNEVYEIKNQINQFGISDRQRYFLIYALSMELENIENSRAISKLVLECRPDINILHDD